jgi:hypothetical protein
LFFEFIICKITIIIIIIIIKFFCRKNTLYHSLQGNESKFSGPFFFGSKKLKITFFKETSFFKNIS